MNKELRSWLFLVALQLTWIIPCSYAYTHQEPVVEEELIEETEDIIRWKIDGNDVSIQEMQVEVVKNAEMKSLGTFKITAYCPCQSCSADYGTQTSTGAVATEGRTVAVDPTVISYGTVVVINGHEYVAEDCGGSIKGNDIDIFFESHETALEFGIQYAEVFIKQKNIPTPPTKEE